ncbi:hypothetical protein TNCV_2937831 [Trichonephila clavipes]|nr:hypothetical protein TNCV_2937831 [Trichonephila clavipes]
MTDSWPVCHEFELSVTVEGVMYVISVEVPSPPFGVMWNSGERGFTLFERGGRHSSLYTIPQIFTQTQCVDFELKTEGLNHMKYVETQSSIVGMMLRPYHTHMTQTTIAGNFSSSCEREDLP